MFLVEDHRSKRQYSVSYISSIPQGCGGRHWSLPECELHALQSAVLAFRVRGNERTDRRLPAKREAVYVRPEGRVFE